MESTWVNKRMQQQSVIERRFFFYCILFDTLIIDLRKTYISSLTLISYFLKINYFFLITFILNIFLIVKSV